MNGTDGSTAIGTLLGFLSFLSYVSFPFLFGSKQCGMEGIGCAMRTLSHAIQCNELRGSDFYFVSEAG
jgi:hypothetical protein